MRAAAVVALIGAWGMVRPMAVRSRVVSRMARVIRGWLVPMIEARALRRPDQRWVMMVARRRSRGDRVLAPKPGSAWLRGVRGDRRAGVQMGLEAGQERPKSRAVTPVSVGWDSQAGACSDCAIHVRPDGTGGGGVRAAGCRV